MSISHLIPMTGGSSPTVTLDPNITTIPGYTVLESLTNGLGGWALMAAMAGVLIGAVVWALGHYSQNYQLAYNGRRGVLVSGLAAILVGGAPHIINDLVHQGGSIP